MRSSSTTGARAVRLGSSSAWSVPDGQRIRTVSALVRAPRPKTKRLRAQRRASPPPSPAAARRLPARISTSCPHALAVADPALEVHAERAVAPLVLRDAAARPSRREERGPGRRRRSRSPAANARKVPGIAAGAASDHRPPPDVAEDLHSFRRERHEIQETVVVVVEELRRPRPRGRSGNEAEPVQAVTQGNRSRTVLGPEEEVDAAVLVHVGGRHRGEAALRGQAGGTRVVPESSVAQVPEEGGTGGRIQQRAGRGRGDCRSRWARWRSRGPSSPRARPSPSRPRRCRCRCCGRGGSASPGARNRPPRGRGPRRGPRPRRRRTTRRKPPPATPRPRSRP